MTVMSDTDITSLARSLIAEATEKFWTDEEITLYIKVAMTNVQNKYWYLLAPTDAKVAETNLVAATESVSLPTDCAKVLRVEVAETRALLRKIEPNELWKFSVYDDGAAAANYLNIWYLEYYDATTDFPVALRPLIACEAALLAATKDKNINHINALYNKFEDAALIFLSTDSMYEPTIMGDYELGQQYTDSNPCAWAFRDGKIYLYKGYSETN